MDGSDIIICILLIIAIAMVIYNIFLFLKSREKQTHENYENLGNRKVVILKTHTWNVDLENFAKKIHLETNPYGIDFYILIHDEKNDVANKISDAALRERVIKFREAAIKNMYERGFFSMWLSNHWILLWFYRKYRDQYDYFWTIEYDVRISGDSSRIWTYSGAEDFIYPIPEFHDPNWAWRNHYTGKKFNDHTKWYGYLQLTRYSRRFLEYLDKNFRVGENGQDELIIFSLYKEGGFTGSHKFLNSLINNSWSVLNTDSDRHRELLIQSEKKYQTDPDHLQIFHPVK